MFEEGAGTFVLNWLWRVWPRLRFAASVGCFSLLDVSVRLPNNWKKNVANLSRDQLLDVFEHW